MKLVFFSYVITIIFANSIPSVVCEGGQQNGSNTIADTNKVAEKQLERGVLDEEKFQDATANSKKAKKSNECDKNADATKEAEQFEENEILPSLLVFYDAKYTMTTPEIVKSQSGGELQFALSQDQSFLLACPASTKSEKIFADFQDPKNKDCLFPLDINSETIESQSIEQASTPKTGETTSPHRLYSIKLFDPFHNHYLRCGHSLHPAVYLPQTAFTINNVYREYKCGYKVFIPDTSKKNPYLNAKQALLEEVHKTDVFTFYYDKAALSETLYTSHRLIYTELLLENENRPVNYPLVVHDDLDDRLRSYRNIYDKSKLKSVIEEINEYFRVSEEKYLVEQFLVPHEDMALDAMKRATFSWVNIKPQWNVLTRQWKKITRYIRKLIVEKKLKPIVHSGVYGKLQKISSGHKEWKFNDVPIPANWWKVVTDDGRHFSIIIMSNNPYTSPSENDKLCPKSTCSTAGFEEIQVLDTMGYTYCCSLTPDLIDKLLTFTLISNKKRNNVNFENIFMRKF